MSSVLLADSWQMAAKALRPAWWPWEMSEESRVRRKRYVDLVRPRARAVARQRIAVVRAVRNATGAPRLSSRWRRRAADPRRGAAARPFVTHSEYPRCRPVSAIAPELFLKRCVVGGLERVFSWQIFATGCRFHTSPEFAMLETYRAQGTTTIRS